MYADVQWFANALAVMMFFFSIGREYSLAPTMAF